MTPLSKSSNLQAKKATYFGLYDNSTVVLEPR